ncbi:uncharacterized protein LOC120165710 [Hibiscus syriacus]|uniref:uncharacterized protein LOC120165710 n=1 Tax=Hibiscus syriacus TaxID=106335 RepID=UPI0019244F04|nr:uncharacterized protein LOC120165710 [Hibiscus syriacus]
MVKLEDAIRYSYGFFYIIFSLGAMYFAMLFISWNLENSVSNAFNRSLERKLNASAPLSMFDDIQFTKLNPGHFVQVLHFSLRSARSFVKTNGVGNMGSRGCCRNL